MEMVGPHDYGKLQFLQNEMAKILKLSRDGVAYNIKMLKNNGTLIREGSTRNGIWKIKI